MTPPTTVAELENRDRIRGVEIRECEGRRSLLAQAFQIQQSAIDLQIQAREQRNTRMCRWFGVNCG